MIAAGKGQEYDRAYLHKFGAAWCVLFNEGIPNRCIMEQAGRFCCQIKVPEIGLAYDYSK